MSVFRTFFRGCLALAIFSCATVQAEKFEFTLHDHHIKKDLATSGINLDEAWKTLFDDEGNIQENKRSELSDKIKEIGQTVYIHPSTTQIPLNAQDFSVIFNNLVYKDVDYNSCDNQSNKEYFEKILAVKHKEIVKNFGINTVDKVGLFQNIIEAICTYIDKKAIAARLNASKENTINGVHIYIKVIFDTDHKTTTFQTAPYAAQDGFVKTYSDGDVATWLDEEDTFEEPNEEEDNNQQDSKVSPNHQYSRISRRRSSCGRFAKLATLSLIALSLGVLTHSYINATFQDMIDTETLNAYAEELGVTGYMEQLTEYLSNLNITQ